MEEKAELLRQLPSVDKLLNTEVLSRMLEIIPRSIVLEAVRDVLGYYRQNWQQCELPTQLELIEEVRRAAENKQRPRLRQVINATGIILHTNLGRAVMCQAARQAALRVAGGYTNLEFDLASGTRGSRYEHVRELLVKLTGAEDAMVVNNNAAAVLLVLNTLAKGHETIVSRGQLVEIGGSFRIPDVMLQSGSTLVEVGTTNKTYITDYHRAITDQTAVLLKVHTSNFQVVGFTHEASREELVQLGQETSLPVVEDLGSGFLVDLSAFGLKSDEPTVLEAVSAGVDVVTFSGDKLLGGPQAGIVVGKQELVARMKSNPLTRALRVDKMTIAALEATLREYLDPQRVIGQIPTLRMLTEAVETVKERAENLQQLLEEDVGFMAKVTVEGDYSEAGGGALPLVEIPSFTVTMQSPNYSIDTLVTLLRRGDPAVIARIKNDKLIFDLRTVAPEEVRPLAGAIKSALMRRSDGK